MQKDTLKRQRVLEAERKRAQYHSTKSSAQAEDHQRGSYNNSDRINITSTTTSTETAAAADDDDDDDHAISNPKRAAAFSRQKAVVRRETEAAEETPSSRKLDDQANQRRLKNKKKSRKSSSSSSLDPCDARDDSNIVKNCTFLEKQFYNVIRYSCCSIFCVSCRLGKFRKQVVKFPWKTYNANAEVANEEENENIIKRTVSWYIDESVSIHRNQQNKILHFICCKCKSALTAKPEPRMPKLNFRNQLDFEKTPQELNSLNTLEENLLAQRLICVKIIILPRGSYPAVKFKEIITH